MALSFHSDEPRAGRARVSVRRFDWSARGQRRSLSIPFPFVFTPPPTDRSPSLHQRNAIGVRSECICVTGTRSPRRRLCRHEDGGSDCERERPPSLCQSPTQADHRARHPHTRTHADTTVPSKGQRRACALADRDATAATAAVAASGWRCAPLRLPLQPPAATVWLFSFRPPAPPLSHRDTFNRRCAWPIGRRCPIMTPRSTALPPPPPPPAPRCWPTAPFSPSPDRCACAQIHWAISYRSGWISFVALAVTGVAAAL